MEHHGKKIWNTKIQNRFKIKKYIYIYNTLELFGTYLFFVCFCVKKNSVPITLFLHNWVVYINIKGI